MTPLLATSAGEKMFRSALVIFLIVVTQPTFAERDTRIKVSIEEPVRGERYSGISNLRGWAVSPEGMGSYYLSVYIDEEFAFYLYPYGDRPDVGEAFPDYPDSDTGGFSMAYNYKALSPGEHKIRVRAFDNDGNYNDAETNFTTEKFVSAFISSDSAVDVSTSESWTIIDKQTYLVSGATLEGKQWDFLLKWDRASQSFKMEGIGPLGSEGSGDTSGGNNSGGTSGGNNSGGTSGGNNSGGTSGGNNSGGETASCKDFSGTWSGRLNTEVVLTSGGQTYRRYPDYERTLYIRQSGCSITFTQNEPNINTLSGSITDSKATLSGSPYSFSTFNREFKKFLSNEGLSAEPNVQSITFAGDMTLTRDSSSSNPYDNNRLYVRFVTTARGTARTAQGTVSFQWSDSRYGYFYQ